MTPGETVVFADREPDVHKPTAGEPGLVRGVINGEPFEHGDITYVPVYVREGDRCMYVDARNVVEASS